MTRTLIVMARAPAYGVGKTRLARGVGKLEALRINRRLQAQTLRVAVDPRWRTLLAVTPEGALNTYVSAWPHEVTRISQGRSDLGARLARVMRSVRGPVAVIGTDSPGVRARDIAAAFKALGCAPVAIGPSGDGGFWILAARNGAKVARAFAGVRWSSAHTLGDLVERLRTPHARVRVIDDVDDADDWRRLRGLLALRARH